MLRIASKIIDAQEKILVAYRITGRTPAGAIDDLARYRPIWDAYVEEHR